MRSTRESRSWTYFIQYIGEKSKEYYTRFELKYTEIKDLGEILSDGEIGMKIFKGLLTINKQILHSFMAAQNISCNLQNMETMCTYLDSLNDDPVPHRENIASINKPPSEIKAFMASDNTGGSQDSRRQETN